MRKLLAICAAWTFFVIAAVGNWAAKDFAGALECCGLALLAMYLVE